jgi:hypothetical protein
MFIKKGFPFFAPFLHLWLQSLKKVLIWPKKIIFEKNRKRYQKTQNFTLISNPLKNFQKNVPKKVIRRNVAKICTFSTFTHVRQTCFVYNFFVNFLKTFSTDLKSAWNSACFIPFMFKKKIKVIFLLFSNFEAKRKKTAPKKKKRSK